MATDFRKFDEQGFPLPPRFDDLKFYDDEPPRRRQISLKAKRLVLLAVLLGVIVPVVFGPKILAAGRLAIAHWLSGRAEEKYLQENYGGAINDASWALGWSPDSRELYFLRAQCREKVNDLNGSLADWTQSIGLTTSSVELSLVHSNRSLVYVRLEKYREAIDDASQAVRLSPTSSNLNTRAYVRALANMELPDGLADINKAMEENGEENPEFLDTRGYLLHLLDRNDDAMKDLDRAIGLTERFKLMMQLQRNALDPRSWQAQVKETNHNLAVMYHHRGLVNDKLSRKDESEKDLRLGDQLGYNPARGVM